YNLGIKVAKNDTLEFRGSGGWGSISTTVDKYLWGLVSVSTTSADCDQVSLTGYVGSSLSTNQGQAAGLFATDGTEIFLLGSSAKKTINNNGALKIGFNAPWNLPNGCASLTITDLRVTRCFDAQGNTYPCQ